MKSLVFFLFAFGVGFTTGNVTFVQTCPETKAAWDYRSSMFSCEDGNMKYHCVMTNIWNLVEVCIAPLNATGNDEGCPSVYIFESSAYWIFPFTPCPVQNTECPQKRQRGYSSEELFKYPSCFRNLSERTSRGNEIRQTTTRTRFSTSNDVRDELYRSDVNYIPYTFTALFLLIIVLFVFIFLQSRRIRNHITKVESMIQERKRQTSGNSTSSCSNNIDIPMASLEVPDGENIYTDCEDIPFPSLDVPDVENIYTNFEDKPMASLEVPLVGNIYTDCKDKPMASLEVPLVGNIYTDFEDKPMSSPELSDVENIYTDFEDKPMASLEFEVPLVGNIYTDFKVQMQQTTRPNAKGRIQTRTEQVKDGHCHFKT